MSEGVHRRPSEGVGGDEEGRSEAAERDTPPPTVGAMFWSVCKSASRSLADRLAGSGGAFGSVSNAPFSLSSFLFFCRSCSHLLDIHEFWEVSARGI